MIMRPRVVINQQEFAESKFKAYIEAGISAEKATGIADRIITTLNGNPLFPFHFNSKKLRFSLKNSKDILASFLG